MNFSKAKSIFIYIFIFVNLFLLIMYKQYTKNEKEISNEEIVSILSNNNVALSPKIIENYKKTIDSIEVCNMINDKAALISSLLGKSYETENDNLYKTENKSLSFNDSLIRYSNNAPDKGFKRISELNIGNKVVDRLNKLGISNSTLSVYSVSKNPESDYYITLIYKYKGRRLFNHNLYITANEQGIKSIEGAALSFTSVKNQVYRIISPQKILIEFIQNRSFEEQISINEINLGYYLPVEQFNVSFYAIPTYEIKTSEGKAYFYDARVNISSDFRLLSIKSDSF